MKFQQTCLTNSFVKWNRYKSSKKGKSKYKTKEKLKIQINIYFSKAINNNGYDNNAECIAINAQLLYYYVQVHSCTCFHWTKY